MELTPAQLLIAPLSTTWLSCMFVHSCSVMKTFRRIRQQKNQKKKTKLTIEGNFNISGGWKMGWGVGRWETEKVRRGRGKESFTRHLKLKGENKGQICVRRHAWYSMTLEEVVRGGWGGGGVCVLLWLSDALWKNFENENGEMTEEILVQRPLSLQP